MRISHLVVQDPQTECKKVGEFLVIFFRELDKLLPMQYRVRVIACTAFFLVCTLAFVDFRIFARNADLQQFKSDVRVEINSAVVPLNSKLKDIDSAELEQSINSKLRIACVTPEKDYHEELMDEVRELEEKYYHLTGDGYRQPECSQL